MNMITGNYAETMVTKFSLRQLTNCTLPELWADFSQRLAYNIFFFFTVLHKLTHNCYDAIYTMWTEHKHHRITKLTIKIPQSANEMCLILSSIGSKHRKCDYMCEVSIIAQHMQQIISNVCNMQQIISNVCNMQQIIIMANNMKCLSHAANNNTGK